MKPSTANAYREATAASVLGLVVNFSLAVVKLVGGLLGHSFALISDAANSMGDVLTSLVVLFALRVAQKPADSEHPYGHTRIEAVAGSNVAVLILVSAVWIGWEAIGRFSTTHPLPPIWTLWIAGGNAAIKESLYRYKMRIGRRTGSSAVIANAWDHRSDALCSLAVLVGLGIVRVGGPQYIWADEIAALFVVAAISWTAIKLLQQSTNELMDVQANNELVDQMRMTAIKVEGVKDIEKFRVRKSGLEYFADIHVQVDPQATVEKGHAIGHAAKEALLSEHGLLRDVLVHLEPYRPANIPNKLQ
ncbi:putative cation efflux system protein [Novipirellula aureliae]|uniref:Putative cation efflux system protein n=1 Tax=Novipirellula aureliae TaxID=2527966 RepID=A0A5C6DXT8_9BACT|nr:cation diffusion facilitator family transporter [Novipirellula aureliae]TWU39866.1 putative cation efflux system protein [Novipirellula aureliae]